MIICDRRSGFITLTSQSPWGREISLFPSNKTVCLFREVGGWTYLFFLFKPKAKAQIYLFGFMLFKLSQLDRRSMLHEQNHTHMLP